MRIKKINIWDDSQNRGYEHVIIEIKGDNIPENFYDLCFSIERPGFAESHLAYDSDVGTSWAGSESEKTRLEPELSERVDNSLVLMIGPAVVQHISRGNYTFRLCYSDGNVLAKKVMVWDVKEPIGTFTFKRETDIPSPQADSTVFNSEMGALRERVEKAEQDGDETEFEAAISAILELAPEDGWAIRKREDFLVRQEEKKLKELLNQAQGAYEEKEIEKAEAILNDIEAIRPSYPPAQELKKKMAQGEDTSLDQGTTPVKTNDPEPNSRFVVVVSCVLLAIALAGGGYYFLTKDSETSPEKETSVTLMTETADPKLVFEDCRKGSLTADECYEEAKRIIGGIKDAPDQNLVATAERIFEVSAKAGHAEANRQLGLLYDPGKNLTDDRKTQRPAKAALAYDYYKQAIDKGSTKACDDLELLHSWLKNHAGSDQTLTLLLKVKKWNLSNCGR